MKLNGKTKLIGIAATVISLSACGLKDSTSSNSKSIIDQDERVTLEEQDLNAAIGTIKSNNTFCTGFLISPTKIVTAAHCMFSEDEVSQLEFVPANGGESSDLTIDYISKNRDIMVLESKIKYEKFLQISNPEMGSASVIAMNLDAGQKSDSSCKIESIFDSVLLTHDCDTSKGNSGAPLLQDGKVVGVHLGYSLEADRNIASILEGSDTDLVKNIELSFDPERCNPFNPRTCRPPRIPNPFEALKNGIMNKITVKAANDVSGEAVREGWTSTSCVAAASASILAVTIPTYAAICTAVGLSTAGTGIAPCAAWLAGASTVVVALTCTQLCQDRHLRDCR